MPNEFNEPWKCDETIDGPAIVDATDKSVACPIGCPSDSEFDSTVKQFNRIVACVNACAGVPTAELTPLRMKNLIAHINDA